MQTENNSNAHWEKTIKASDFVLALRSLASTVTTEMHDIKLIANGDTITTFIGDARITIAPREAREGGAA